MVDFIPTCLCVHVCVCGGGGGWRYLFIELAAMNHDGNVNRVPFRILDTIVAPRVVKETFALLGADIQMLLHNGRSPSMKPLLDTALTLQNQRGLQLKQGRAFKIGEKGGSKCQRR